MEKINTVVLSLGSNIENRLEYLRKAVGEISDRIGTVLKISPIYESEALGFQATTAFLNLCLEVHTEQTPQQVLKTTQEIEKIIGRRNKSTNGYQSREIDIDLIFFNEQVIELPELVIPHPEYSARKFVLLPLNDIIPSQIDPISKEPIQSKINQCKDSSRISITRLLI